VTIEALLEGSSPTVAGLTHRLVALVQARAPAATVSVKPGWRLVGFTLQRYFPARSRPAARRPRPPGSGPAFFFR